MAGAVQVTINRSDVSIYERSVSHTVHLHVRMPAEAVSTADPCDES